MRARRAGAGVELALFSLAAVCLLLVLGRRVAVPDRFQPGPREEGSLRVVTWNLGTGVDAGTQGFRGEDLERVASVLAGLDGDLVFLQEIVSKRQVKRLRARLGRSWTYALTENEGGRELAILARGGRLQVLPDFRSDRGIAAQYDRPDGLSLTCVVVHGEAFSAEGRNQTLGAASVYLAARVDQGLTLLAGDFNLDPGIDQRGDLFSNDEYLDLETYNVLLKGRVDLGLHAGPTAEPDRRLDYLLAGEGDFEVLQVGPWIGQRSEPMDHHPLVADLRPMVR